MGFSYVFNKDCPRWHVEASASRLQSLKNRAKAAENGDDLPKVKRVPQGRTHADFSRASADKENLESKLKNGDLVSSVHVLLTTG